MTDAWQLSQLNNSKGSSVVRTAVDAGNKDDSVWSHVQLLVRTVADGKSGKGRYYDYLLFEEAK